MKWLRKLDNPFLLVLQGFAAGAILFGVLNPSVLEASIAPVSVASR